MNRDFKINLGAVGFLLGVGITSRIIGDSLFFYLSVLAFFLVVCWVRGMNLVVSWRRYAYLLLVVTMLIGAVRVWVDWQIDASWREAKIYQKEVLIKGEIINQPILKDFKQSFYLRILELQDLKSNDVSENLKIPKGILLQVKLPGLPELHWRDTVMLGGVLLNPENSEDFNYADYLMKDHVYWLLDKPKLKKIIISAKADYANVYWYLMELRSGFLDKIYEIFSEPVGAIMAGLLIGERTNIQAGILKNFQITGLTHILAISGFNISLIINLISLMVAKRGKWVRYLITLALIVAFVIITGASASVLRAAVMGVLALSIKTMGRSSQILKVILLSGVLMAWINPRIVDFDISFQLSFFATMSLILYADKLQNLWEIEMQDSWKLSKFQTLFLSFKHFAREGMLTTLAAQVITLPIIFYSFGTVSLISPLANLFVGPLIPMIMLFGFMAVMLGFLNGFLALISGSVAVILINLMLNLVAFLANLPLASIVLGKGEIWLAIVYYIGVFRFFHRQIPAPDSARDFSSPHELISR